MEARKRIAILGSTGSIGCQTLDVIAEHPDRFEATVLIAGTRVDKLIEQALAFRPALAIIADESRYNRLKQALAPAGIATAAGQEAINAAMGSDNVDTVVTATVGYSGLAPTIAATKAGKDIALANKETLVVAGELITRLLRTSTSKVIPVDSEHSAIYQCLAGEDPATVRRLIITASGGPFRTRTMQELERVTVHDALRHPNWTMGAKITIDSATMVNKAFEVIEAHWLFDVPSEKIDVAVHPQSIVHSMIEFHDGAIKAQLGQPDMRLPIRYALGDATRLRTSTPGLTIDQYANLTFEKPDTAKFPGLGLARLALDRMGNTACTINAANEVAVAAFLNRRIKFLDIYRIIADTLDRIAYIEKPMLDDYVATNREARAYAESLIHN